MRRLIYQLLLVILFVGVSVPRLASATDIHFHGNVSYYSPYYNHSYDIVEVYDQNNNRLGFSDISGATPHTFSFNFTWNGSRPYTFKMKWVTYDPGKTCWCDWYWNGETDVESFPAFPCNCQQN